VTSPAYNRWGILLCFLLCVAGFYAYTYNSGYGYDALEYLVIGRSLSRGQPLYSLIPSKSPGFYYLISALFSAGLPGNHYAISAVITVFSAATVAGTWHAAKRFFGSRVALVSSLLVGACAVFMEMNFLQPESVVYLSGLAAFMLILQSRRTSRLFPLFPAGLILAAGFLFKSVAGLYLLGILCFLLFQYFRERTDFSDLLVSGSVLSGGFIVGFGIATVVFAALGNLSEFWTWTISFPLLHYPSNTIWLDKLFTKLLWFHLLVVVALLCSVFVPSRRIVWSNSGVVLAFFMAFASYVALLKTQASHYCFPGAGFFSIFIAAVWLRPQERETRVRFARSTAIVAAPILLLLTVSALSYRPNVFFRFLEWRDFHEEELLGARVREQLLPGAKGLFVRNGSFLHWVTGVEPASPLVSFDVQATYFVERNPDALLNALNDQSTGIVEFNPADPGFEDEQFGVLAERSQLSVEFKKLLEKKFRPATINPPFHFWVRKE
jgi:hypothetical protein